MAIAYLCLGTNSGDRKKLIEQAVRFLDMSENIKIIRTSALYETEPWGFSSDHPFLNAAVCCLTHCSPRRVLELTQQVERELGRTRKSAGGHYADRTIDIDILLYDDLVIDEPDLKVPHPLMREREFVMKPLGEIMPCPQGGLRR